MKTEATEGRREVDGAGAGETVRWGVDVVGAGEAVHWGAGEADGVEWSSFEVGL